MFTFDKMDLVGKRVLIREDFNVPMKDGHIAHTLRIDAALPTIQQAIKAKAKVFLMSHLGRPTEGKQDPAFSLAPIAAYLSGCLKQPVPLFELEHVPDLQPGQVALLENVRFLKGEEKNDAVLAKQLAALCDIFVMDAFAVAHRAQASTYGVAEYAPIACAGPLLEKELAAINQILVHPAHPVLAIVGGSKVSTKLEILNFLLEKVDILVLGGGIANTFLAAQNYPVGQSLFEKDFIPTAKEIIERAKKLGKTLWLPTDVVVDSGENKPCQAVGPNDKIFDIGAQSQQALTELIKTAKTILWNGPVGIFENPLFAHGTRALANAIAQSKAFSVAGGGDTLAAIEQFNVGDKISYLSTGGGAFLEALEGKTLPAVRILKHRES